MEEKSGSSSKEQPNVQLKLARIGVLQTLHNEHATHARHQEEQREKITNLCFLLIGATAVFLPKDTAPEPHLLITLGGVYVLVGIWGFLATAKLYERNRFHVKILEAFLSQIETELGQSSETFADVRARGAIEHYGPCPTPDESQTLTPRQREKQAQDHATTGFSKVRLNYLWCAAPLLIAVGGIGALTFGINLLPCK